MFQKHYVICLPDDITNKLCGQNCISGESPPYANTCANLRLDFKLLAS